MNDRFKFRVWDKEDERMINDIDLTTQDRSLHPVDGSWDDAIDLDSEDVVVQQSTGLKDKTGKLIFEGDILSYEFEHEGEKRKIFEEVYWGGRSTGFGLRIYGKHLKEQGESGGSLHCLVTKIKYQLDGEEIIGNIYENPELLSTGKTLPEIAFSEDQERSVRKGIAEARQRKGVMLD